MEKRILVILDPDVAPGFQLAGIDVWTASTPEEAQKFAEQALASEEYGIVILEEEFLEQFPQKLKDQVMDSVIPLVLPVSIKKTGKIDVAEYLESIIKRATGYQIKVRG